MSRRRSRRTTLCHRRRMAISFCWMDPGQHTIVFGYFDDDGVLEEGEVMVTANITILQAAQGALAETDTFAQVAETGALRSRTHSPRSVSRRPTR